MSAQIRERQEAGRLHREAMYLRRKEKLAEYQREYMRRPDVRARYSARLRAQRKARNVSRRKAEDVALIRQAEELSLARSQVAGEVADLVRDQERDERFGHRVANPWSISLDGPDQYGRPLHETVAA